MIAARKVIKPFFIVFLISVYIQIFTQGTRLLRQPAISASQIAFAYGGGIWVKPKSGGDACRITSTAAVEGNPRFSPDGQWTTFSSNRSGISQVYNVPAQGGIFASPTG